jgi:hypothetical protein
VNDSRAHRASTRLHASTLIGVAVVALFGVACAAIAGLSSAGDALQDADFEVHDLAMEQDDVVYADLERPDGATDIEYFEQAAAIVWDHLDDQAQGVEIRLRGPGQTDEIVTYTTDDLQQIHQDRDN